MLSLLRIILSGRVPRGGDPHDGASGGADAGPPPEPSELEALEALWRRAQAEPAPFRRDAMVKEVAAGMARATAPALKSYCLSLLPGDPARAEDVTQAAFLTFWRQLPRFEGRSSLRTFLYGIAFNLCRQQRRDDASDRSLEQAHEVDIRLHVHPEPMDDGIESELERRARRLQVEACLARLDERDAWLLRVRLVQQLEYGEILPLYQARFGARITTPEGLRTAFFHAKTRLFAALEEAT